ncbi:hypothetical protein RDABS01_017168 [Bienertia sinuspersici]
MCCHYPSSARNYEPTHKAYNILLDAFAISGMVEQARTVFKCMRRDRYSPDLCSYTTMLSAYINASDMDGAEKFFKRLRLDGLEPNIVTYGTLLKGYAKVNDLEKMMGKYEEMLSHGMKLNQTIFTTIMDTYGKNRDFASALYWFKEMGNHGCPPDQKAKNILLSLATTENERKEANQLAGSKASYQTFHECSTDDIDEAFESDDSDNETEVKILSGSHAELQDVLMVNKGFRH